MLVFVFLLIMVMMAAMLVFVFLLIMVMVVLMFVFIFLIIMVMMAAMLVFVFLLIMMMVLMLVMHCLYLLHQLCFQILCPLNGSKNLLAFQLCQRCCNNGCFLVVLPDQLYRLFYLFFGCNVCTA